MDKQPQPQSISAASTELARIFGRPPEGDVAPLSWRFGKTRFSCARSVAANINLTFPAAAMYLTGRIAQPRSMVSAEDISKHIGRLFPSLAIRFFTRAQMRQHYPPEPPGISYYGMQLPDPVAGRPCTATLPILPNGQVRISHLLHALGSFVLISAGSITSCTAPLDGVAARDETLALLATLHYCQDPSDSDARTVRSEEIVDIAAYFAAYAIAYYLHIDPRCVSHTAIAHEANNPLITGFNSCFAYDIGPITQTEEALGRFIEERSGVTRRQWQDHLSESFRIAVVNRLTRDILAYRCPAPSRGGMVDELAASIYSYTWQLVADGRYVPKPNTMAYVAVFDRPLGCLTGDIDLLVMSAKESGRFEHDSLNDPSLLVLHKIEVKGDTTRFSFHSPRLFAEALCTTNWKTGHPTRPNLVFFE